MFSLFRKPKPLKGYKITTIDRKQKYGVAADSLKMLKDKAANKLKVSVSNYYTLIRILVSEAFIYILTIIIIDKRVSCIFGQRWNGNRR